MAATYSESLFVVAPSVVCKTNLKAAAVLSVKYRKLPDGEFSHTTKIILLDRDGTQIASTDQLGRTDAAFLEAIRMSLQ